MFKFSSKQSGTFLTILGLTLAYKPWGNCFAPAIVVEPYRLRIHKDSKETKQACKVIFRSRNHLETTFYWYGGLSFHWNSEHLAKAFARKYGVVVEADFGDVHQWMGHTWI